MTVTGCGSWVNESLSESLQKELFIIRHQQRKQKWNNPGTFSLGTEVESSTFCGPLSDLKWKLTWFIFYKNLILLKQVYLSVWSAYVDFLTPGTVFCLFVFSQVRQQPIHLWFINKGKPSIRECRMQIATLWGSYHAVEENMVVFHKHCYSKVNTITNPWLWILNLN